MIQFRRLFLGASALRNTDKAMSTHRLEENGMFAAKASECRKTACQDPDIITILFPSALQAVHLMIADPFLPLPVMHVYRIVSRSTSPFFMLHVPHVPLLRLAALHKSYVQLWHSTLC